MILARKLFLLPLVAVWLVASPAMSQDGYSPKWASQLFGDKLTHDFGTVARGATAEHHFVLENIFLEDVEIGAVSSSCGCTKLNTTKKLVKTYDTAEIVAELDTQRFVGFKESTINVALTFRPQDRSRPAVSANLALKIRAFIRGDVVFQPGEVQFGTLSPGQAAEKRVTLTYAGIPNWKLVEAASPASYLAVAFKETGRAYDPNLKATQVVYDVSVKLNDAAPTGYFQEQVSLKTNDPDVQKSHVPLVVRGYIVPTLSVNPTVLMLGEVKSGESVSKPLVVSGIKGKPFRVAGVTGPDEQFRFTPPADAKDVQVIGVQFTAGNKPGKIVGKIHITTDSGAAVDVDVDGQVVAGDRAAPPTGPAAAGAAKPETAKPDVARPEAARPEVPKPDAGKTDAIRPSRPSLDAANPSGNVLRSPPGPLKSVEPDARP
jgi:hypothetical protein